MRLRSISLEQLTPVEVWSALDPETRGLAAEAVYGGPGADPGAAAEADVAIARAARFRLVAVRRLPMEKRRDYLVRLVRPDDSLAATLLRALHLIHRSELLSAFLDELGIPHEEGAIDPEFDFDANRPDAKQLLAATATLDARFPTEQVELYAMSLLAMDPQGWSPLHEVLLSRRADASPIDD
jgi:hypothetical protein